MRKKVSVIGAGNVGSSTAQLIAEEGIADVLLFDVLEGIPQGKALDIAQACPLWNSSVSVTGTTHYDDIADSDVIVITAGFPRKPGMSRDDLLFANTEIVCNVVAEASKRSPHAVMIVVTNPMDVMARLAMEVSLFDHSNVVGMGGVLDSARFRYFISLEMGISPNDIEALVLGGHGDQMVPLPRFTAVKGIPITTILARDKIESLVRRTRDGGAEIVSFLKTGSAHYAPAASTYQMVKAIILDEKRILPCSAYLSGQYGVSGVYIGVPVILGRKGVEKVIELELNEEERKDFARSVTVVKELFDKIENL